jgi:hypothetical protein
MFRHPSHTPHRFRFTYFFLGLVAAIGVEEKEGTEEEMNVDVEEVEEEVEVEVPVKNKMLNVKTKKVELINSRTECGKRCSNIFYWVKKKTCLGAFRNRGDT